MAEHSAVASAISTMGKNRVAAMNDVMSVSQLDEKSSLPMKLLHFNISGQRFLVSGQLVKKYPDSKFNNPVALAGHWMEDEKMFYFDRDPALFNTVLNVFRYEVLNIPSGYDRNLVMKELSYWWIPTDDKSFTQNQEEERLEADFQWLENRIPPPPSDAKNWLKTRYKVWCFITDPIGPYTSWRKLSFTCCLLTVLFTLLYLILFGLSTSIRFRDSIHPNHTRNISDSEYAEMDMLSEAEAIGCKSLSKLDCYLQSEPKLWIATGKSAIMAMFVGETIIRLLLCPGLAYFKSVINWLDIIAGTCAIFVYIGKNIEEELEAEKAKSAHYIIILLDSIQVLRVFKIFQYASVLDGLMIMILTIKACLKELLLLVMYLVIAMFLFSTLIFFVEIEAETGTGIPDATIGYWWSIITMTTVGYGDYYPTTTGGYFIGTMCAITGIILTALPVAVIGSNFNVYWEHSKKRRAALMTSINDEWT